MFRKLFVFSIAVLSALNVSAQDKTRFYAEASTTKAVVGETIEVVFNLENGKGNAKFSPPDWEAAGFVALGSSQASSISIANGETRSAAKYTFNITPAEAGTLTIPSVSIKNGGEELRTEPIQIQALPNADGTAPERRSKNQPAWPQPKPKKSYKTTRL